MADPTGSQHGSGSTSGGGLADAWRDVMTANARYYEAWGQLASQWMRDLAEATKGARLPQLPPLQLPPIRLSSTPGGGSAAPAATTARAQPPASAPGAAVLVLEGVTGQHVSAAFLVENSLSHPVEGAVGVEPFEDADGSAVLVRLDFDPPVVSLDPGERRLVTVSVDLPASLPADVACSSTIKVQGVPGTTIPVRLRRVGG